MTNQHFLSVVLPEWLLMAPTGMWYKSNTLPPLAEKKVEIDPFFPMNNHGLLDTNANRKTGSRRSHERCSAICGVLNKAFKPGKSIKMYLVKKKKQTSDNLLTTPRLSSFIAKPCSFP